MNAHAAEPNVNAQCCWREALAFMKLLATSEAEVALERTVSQDEAFERAEAEIYEAEVKT